MILFIYQHYFQLLRNLYEIFKHDRKINFVMSTAQF